MATRLDRLSELRALASKHDSQFATSQAAKKGFSYRALMNLRDAGEIHRLRRSVWRFTSAAGDPDPAITACLAAWPHGVISHASAAQQHRFKRVAVPHAPHITVPYGVPCDLSGVNAHRSRSLEQPDIVMANGVRYTNKARTVCDLGDARDPFETLGIVDDAVASGLLVNGLHATAVRLQTGRSGVALIAKATSKEAAGIFRSWLERSAGHIYRVAGLPDPEWNVPIRDECGLIGLADAFWRLWRVISEKEGLRYHTLPKQRRRDADRFNRFLDANYDPRRFTWEDVVHRPVHIAATVQRALRNAGADLDPATIPRTILLPDRPFL